jgi:hypothetical protein
MKRLEGMANCVTLDDTTGRHDGLGRAQSALAVFVIYEREDVRISRSRFVPLARFVQSQHWSDQVRKQGARHRARGARIEISHQRNRLFAVERALDRNPSGFDQVTQLCSRARHLDLELAHSGHFARESNQKRYGQSHAA